MFVPRVNACQHLTLVTFRWSGRNDDTTAAFDRGSGTVGTVAAWRRER
jgi:hypothetical protein